jgi:hypothetical protein
MKNFTRLFSALFFLISLTNFVNSQTVYTWNGSVNSNFSTAGNWTPIRQIGLVNDILVFENSGSLNVINVYQVTIGQLIVKNNTNLSLSPASGNAKLLTVKGCPGEDLVVESGSSLNIFGNDPALNFYLSTGATASINGNLSFEGNIGHYLNAADQSAINFNNGSTFTQKCPGNIFNIIGTPNAVVFRSGSKFRIDHTNAINPFGMSSPNSKVLFESSSNLVIIKSGALQLTGRTIADLTIEEGSNISITENFTSDISVANLTVKNGAELKFKNTNTNYIPSFNIHGNITVNGIFKFSDVAASKFNINFIGSELQNISGSGEISIPSNLNKFELSNTISLQKNLTVNCPIVVKRYEIILNGFQFSYNPEFGNPFTGSKTLVIGTGKTRINNETTNNSINVMLPSEYAISQNYPNPFNPATKIDFSIPKDSKVSIKVYDITGKEVATIMDTELNAGYHTVNFNASSLSSGVYFYTINSTGYTKTLKMILAK